MITITITITLFEKGLITIMIMITIDYDYNHNWLQVWSVVLVAQETMLTTGCALLQVTLSILLDDDLEFSTKSLYHTTTDFALIIAVNLCSLSKNLK